MDDSTENVLKKKGGLPHHRFLSLIVLALDLVVLLYIASVLDVVPSKIGTLDGMGVRYGPSFDTMISHVWVCMAAFVVGLVLFAKEIILRSRKTSFLVNVVALVAILGVGFIYQAVLLLRALDLINYEHSLT